MRPVVLASDDQMRVAPPEAALAAGADQLVIMRPINGASNPWFGGSDVGGEAAGGLGRRLVFPPSLPWRGSIGLSRDVVGRRAARPSPGRGSP